MRVCYSEQHVYYLYGMWKRWDYCWVSLVFFCCLLYARFRTLKIAPNVCKKKKKNGNEILYWHRSCVKMTAAIFKPSIQRWQWTRHMNVCCSYDIYKSHNRIFHFPHHLCTSLKKSLSNFSYFFSILTSSSFLLTHSLILSDFKPLRMFFLFFRLICLHNDTNASTVMFIRRSWDPISLLPFFNLLYWRYLWFV